MALTVSGNRSGTLISAHPAYGCVVIGLPRSAIYPDDSLQPVTIHYSLKCCSPLCLCAMPALDAGYHRLASVDGDQTIRLFGFIRECCQVIALSLNLEVKLQTPLLSRWIASAYIYQCFNVWHPDIWFALLQHLGRQSQTITNLSGFHSV